MPIKENTKNFLVSWVEFQEGLSYRTFLAYLSKKRKKMRGGKSRFTFKAIVVFVYLRLFQVNLFIDHLSSTR